jgi:hypothetical protein
MCISPVGKPQKISRKMEKSRLKVLPKREMTLCFPMSSSDVFRTESGENRNDWKHFERNRLTNELHLRDAQDHPSQRSQQHENLKPKLVSPTPSAADFLHCGSSRCCLHFPARNIGLAPSRSRPSCRCRMRSPRLEGRSFRSAARASSPDVRSSSRLAKCETLVGWQLKTKPPLTIIFDDRPDGSLA